MGTAARINSDLERSSVGLGLRVARTTLKYNSSAITAATTTGKFTLTSFLPAWSMVLGTKVNVKTAFTGGNTTAVLTLGKTDTQDEFNNGTGSINIYTAGQKGVEAEDVGNMMTAATSVYGVITVSTLYTALTAGEMTIEIFYLSTEYEGA